MSSSHATNVLLPYSIFLLFIFSIVSQLGFHFWPDFSYIDGIRIDYLSPTIYFSDIVSIALVLSNLSYIWRLTKLRITKILIVILFLLVLRCFFQESVFLGLISVARLTQIILISVIVRRFFTQNYYKKTFAYVLAAVLLLVSALTISQWIHQGSIGGIWYFLGERTFNGSTPGIANVSLQGNLLLRPYATFPHPNVLGGFILIYLILLFSFLKNQVVSKKEAIFFILTILVSLAALTLSLSRSAVFAGGFIAVILLLRFRKKHIKKWLILVFILAALVLVISPVLVSRFMYFSLEDSALDARLVLFDQGMQLLTNHYLFGTGPNEYLPTLQKQLSPAFSYLQPIHNSYLLFIIESGIVGVALLLVAGFYVLKNLRQIRLFRLTKMSLLIILIIISSVDHYFYSLQQGRMLLGIIVGFVLIDPSILGSGRAKNIRKKVGQIH